MAHLCGRPVLEYILDLLEEHRILDAAVTLRYIPSAITAHFGEGYRSMRLSFSEEEKPLGTAGSVRLAVDSPVGRRRGGYPRYQRRRPDRRRSERRAGLSPRPRGGGDPGGQAGGGSAGIRAG